MVYVSADMKLKYFLGRKPSVVSRLARKMLLLGYMGSLGRLFLVDKELNLYSYELLQPVLQYQQAVLEKDFELAEKLFPSIPPNAHLKLAKFLEINEYKDYAYKITPDAGHKLSLAIELGLLDEALELARQSGKPSSWKQVGDLSLAKGHFDTAEKCFQAAQDLPSLFLLYSATSDRQGLAALQEKALSEGVTNIAFLSNFLLVAYRHKC